MKKFVLVPLLLATATFAAQAGGYHHSGGWHRGSSVSFYFGGGYPCYSPWSSYSYYPSYSYPAYTYDYGYSRPNYAVGGTLFGALAGGLIGNSIHHQGWEGAGIGAATGLVLGGIAEHNTRVRERAYYSAPTVSSSSANTIADAPAVNTAPTIPDAAQIPNAPAVPASPMSGANSLFGR